MLARESGEEEVMMSSVEGELTRLRSCRDEESGGLLRERMRLRDGKRECSNRWRASGAVRRSLAPDGGLVSRTGRASDTRGNGGPAEVVEGVADAEADTVAVAVVVAVAVAVAEAVVVAVEAAAEDFGEDECVWLVGRVAG